MYPPGTWEPGDPLYVRPSNAGEGNHVRKLFEVFDIGDELDDCRCSDASSWPTPRPSHDLASSANAIPGLSYTLRANGDASDAA